MLNGLLPQSKDLYAAPEIMEWAGTSLDFCTSDVLSLSMVLYVMLTSDAPFQTASNEHDVMYEKVQQHSVWLLIMLYKQ